MKKSILFAALVLVFGCLYTSAQTERSNRQSSNSPNLVGTIWETEQLTIPKTDWLIKYVYFFTDGENVKRATFINDQSAGFGPADIYNPRVSVPTGGVHTQTEKIGTYKITGNTIYIRFSDETLEAEIRDGVLLLEVKRGGDGLKSYKASYHTIPPTANKFLNQQPKKPVHWIIDGKYADELNRSFASGSYAEGVETLTKAIKLEPDNPLLWGALAAFHSELKQYREAINDYDQAIRICSQPGLEVEDEKKSDETMNPAELYARLYNTPLSVCALSYHSRGVAKKMLGDEVGASEDFRKACSLGGEEDCKLLQVPADSPLLGTWTYVEYFELPSYVPPEAREALKRVKTSMTAVFSKDGTLEITTHSFMDLVERTSWNYVPHGEIAGTLEQYKGSEMLSKSTVKWVNTNQFEYTVTYHKDSRLIGTKITWTRSESIHFR